MDTAAILNLELYGDLSMREELRRRFLRNDYIGLPKLLSDRGLELLKSEVVDLIEKVATRRDFEMACMGNSPRRMSTVGGHKIVEISVLIPLLYESTHLIRFLRNITGEPLIPVPDPVERHVANFLDESGDTHGAHFDDYPIALVMFIEAPDSERAGGMLEYVPNARDLSDLDTFSVRRAFHQAGDAYVLKTDTSAHRATPLKTTAHRTVLNFAYATKATAKIKTESANLLYA
jgi:hypothetical protein